MTKDNPIFKTIENIIKNNNIVLYLKGTALSPQCEFSAAVVKLLNNLGVVYKDINVLENAEIRKYIKVFSGWPHLPQLYVKGEFIGGCDIVRKMSAEGELQELFIEKGIPFVDKAA